MEILANKIVEILGEARTKQLSDTSPDGKVVIPLKDKLMALFEGRYRIYQNRVREAMAIFSIDKRLDIDFAKLAEWDITLASLVDPKSYRETVTFQADKDVDTKENTGLSVDRYASTFSTNKNRAGNAQHGEEYDLQETWDKEDKFIADSYEASKVKLELKTTDTKGVVHTTHDLVKKPTDFTQPIYVPETENAKLVFNSVDISSTRSLADSRSGNTSLKDKQQILHSESNGARKKSIESENVRRAWHSQLLELKSIIINEFVYCLTKQYCGG